MFRIVVAARDLALRDGLTDLLSGEPGLSVVGRGGEGDDVLDLVRRTRPDVVLVDLVSDVAAGLGLVAALQRTFPGLLSVAVLGGGHQVVTDAFLAGASAFLRVSDLENGLPAAGRRFLLPFEALDPSLGADSPEGPSSWSAPGRRTAAHGTAGPSGTVHSGDRTGRRGRHGRLCGWFENRCP